MKAAANGEHYECSEMYPRFAEEEGFKDITFLFRSIAKIEKGHEERYKKLLANLLEKKIFKREKQVIWQCSNCGTFEGKGAPDLCHVCKHPQDYFEIIPYNY